MFCILQSVGKVKVTIVLTRAVMFDPAEESDMFEHVCNIYHFYMCCIPEDRPLDDLLWFVLAYGIQGIVLKGIKIAIK
jgi:hypothetical protein